MKIGILGGTFDPIHYGHLKLAKIAQAQFALEKIIFVPALRPPHKKTSDILASAEDRYEMTRLAVEEAPGFEVSDCEIKRKGISYTIDTLKEFEEQYPGAEFFVILGKDSFSGIDSWREASEIKKRARFLVAKRGPDLLQSPTAIPAQWVQMPLCPISASGIRDAIKESRNVDDVLPQKVRRFIETHHLYRKK